MILRMKVVGHRPRGLDVRDLKRNRVGFEDPDPDREDVLAVLIAKDHDRHVRDRVDHETLDRHLDQHVRLCPLARREPVVMPAASDETASASSPPLHPRDCWGRCDVSRRSPCDLASRPVLEN